MPRSGTRLPAPSPSCATSSCRRSSNAAAPPRAAAGCRSSCSCDARERSPGPCRSSPSPTPTANTFSTGPGPMPTSATASSTTPSSCRRVPFTPVRGRRILAAGAAERRSLVAAALELARESSSLHVLFPLEDEARLMHEHGMLLRRTVQFHWRNEGYRTSRTSSRGSAHARRKNIRQERRRVGEAGVRLRWLEGAAIERRDWEFFNRCYRRDLCGARLEPVPQPGILPAHRLDAAREPGDGAGRARGPADRFRPVPHRCGNSVRPILGRDRARAAVALRMLLLPADRVRDRAAASRCSRAARRASTRCSAA